MKTNTITAANHNQENILKSQQEHEIKSCKMPGTQENGHDQVMIDFSFDYD